LTSTVTGSAVQLAYIPSPWYEVFSWWCYVTGDTSSGIPRRYDVIVTSRLSIARLYIVTLSPMSCDDILMSPLTS